MSSSDEVESDNNNKWETMRQLHDSLSIIIISV